MDIQTLFKNSEAARDEYLRLQGYFYGWKELIKYYLSFGCTEKGKKIFRKFQELHIDYTKPYAVVGNKHLLRAFAAYYLRTVGTVRKGFVKHNLKEFAFQYDSEKTFAEDDIMFLVSPKYDNYYGNTMRTLEANIMYTICRRIEDNQITILLMESPIEELITKEELKFLDLYKEFSLKSTKTISIKKEADKYEQDNNSLIDEFISMYPKLRDIPRSEFTAWLNTLRQGKFQLAYDNIMMGRKK